MTQVTVKQRIDATPEIVFRAVSDIASFPDASPEVLKIEFLSEQTAGVGTRFRETRLNNGKEMTFDLEVTELDPEARRIRFVNDSHGTVWDSLLTAEARGSQTELTVTMDCRGHKLMARVLNVLFQGMYRKGMKKHVAALKAYCESRPR